MLLSNYKFSFMGNIQLQVVNENPESLMPVNEEGDSSGTGTDFTDKDNAALFIKFHSLSFINGLKRHFPASVKMFDYKL